MRASPRRTSGPFSRIVPPASAAKPCPEQEEFTSDLVKLIKALSVYAAATQNDSRTQPLAELRLADQTQQTGRAILHLIHAIKDTQTPIPPLPPLADTDARLTLLEGEIAGLKANFAGELAEREKVYLEEI